MMNKNQVIKVINSILKSDWSDSDVRNGKDIQCMRSWNRLMKEVVFLYEKEGWAVEKRVSISSKGRQLFLNFKNPNWRKR